MGAGVRPASCTGTLIAWNYSFRGGVDAGIRWEPAAWLQWLPCGSP